VESFGFEGRDRSLAKTGEADFDRLVDKLNSMLKRLEETGRAINTVQYRLQSAEIDKQKAVIVSLKKQINAHFVVNVLNSIKLLAEKHEMEKRRNVRRAFISAPLRNAGELTSEGWRIFLYCRSMSL
jgi:sensor histidine kinase YesM